MKLPTGLSKEQKKQLMLQTMHKIIQKNKQSAPKKKEPPKPVVDSSQAKRKERREKKKQPVPSMMTFQSRGNRNKGGRRGSRSLLGA